MVSFDNFRDQDLRDRIMTLQEAERENDIASIEPLFDLVANPTGDSATDVMVRNTLRELLLEHEEAVLQGLASSEPAVVAFCVNTAGEKQLRSAAPQLITLINQEKDKEKLLEILAAMGKILHPSFKDVFARYINHPDPYLASTAVQAVGRIQDESALQALKDHIIANESEDAYSVCTVTAFRSVYALYQIGSDEAVKFLASKIHHPNPTIRRIIHEVLIKLGSLSLEPVLNAFNTGTVNERIMAADILGNIGARDTCNPLITSLDSDTATDPNVRFAVYEALGKIRCMKSLVRLMDGLSQENDHTVLMAVLTGLNRQLEQRMHEQFLRIVLEAPAESGKQDRILQAVVAGSCLTLFEVLYANEELGTRLIDLLATVNDKEVLDAFREKLHRLNDKRALRDYEKLGAHESSETGGRLLAVDDSEAMLNFYRSAGHELGFETVTASNGKDALSHLTEKKHFDLIVVDMNMPIMDGIEFTATVKKNRNFTNIPIIMATTESDKSQARLAKESGVSAFLTKPFTLDVLRTKIKKILGR